MSRRCGSDPRRQSAGFDTVPHIQQAGKRESVSSPKVFVHGGIFRRDCALLQSLVCVRDPGMRFNFLIRSPVT